MQSSLGQADSISLLHLPNDVMHNLIFPLLSKATLFALSKVCSSIQKCYFANQKFPFVKRELMEEILRENNSLALLLWLKNCLKYPVFDLENVGKYLPIATEGTI